MRSPVFLQEIYLSSMTGNFNWIYDSVFPKNKPCWTFFSRNLWQAWCFICWYCCRECLCWEQEQVCILSCIFFFAKWFTAEVGHKIIDQQVIWWTFWYKSIFPVWVLLPSVKVFFSVLEGFLCFLTTDLLSIYQSRNFTMFTTQVSSVLGCRIFIII